MQKIIAALFVTALLPAPHSRFQTRPRSAGNRCHSRSRSDAGTLTITRDRRVSIADVIAQLPEAVSAQRSKTSNGRSGHGAL
jgi:hypothetical protein